MRSIKFELSLLAAFAACTGLAMTPTVSAHPGYLTAFNAAYPTSTLSTRMQTATGSSCYICHQPPNTSVAGNCYKNALVARINAGRTIAQAITDIDAADSDGDGVSNHDEILRVRTDLPGQVGFNPGLIGATGTDPCGPSTAAAVTNTLETPPPACRADFNNSGAISIQDIFDFLTAYFSGAPAADFNHSGTASIQDIFDFLTGYFSGC